MTVSPLAAALEGFASSYSARKDREAEDARSERPAYSPYRTPGVFAGGDSQYGTGAYYPPSTGDQDRDDIRRGIYETADELGLPPIEVAKLISYETAGTFDPRQPGPTTQWGQHRGLIQWGVPQARQYGVDWNDPIRSQLGRDGAIVRYFRDRGWKPGMNGLNAYSIINAGSPYRFKASDANNGGAPGTVADKYFKQMADHERNAARYLGISGGEWSRPTRRSPPPGALDRNDLKPLGRSDPSTEIAVEPLGRAPGIALEAEPDPAVAPPAPPGIGVLPASNILFDPNGGPR
ncbi:hypothetical protein [Mesobacterium pallidum]|uniref:hypothetical protein n=1 Tax=Mesobacterium pallidum TaxID=2872037 RepID=UPI001EE31640|nr:hypothetical protein [Mesobacterium pallidum]